MFQRISSFTFKNRPEHECWLVKVALTKLLTFQVQSLGWVDVSTFVSDLLLKLRMLNVIY